MKLQLKLWTASGAVGLALLFGGCGGSKTRGDADVYDEKRAATPAEGGSTGIRGAAGRPENFGDYEAKRAKEGATAVDPAATGGPGSRERREVTIEVPADTTPPDR
jgi:hypothetical protein